MARSVTCDQAISSAGTVMPDGPLDCLPQTVAVNGEPGDVNTLRRRLFWMSYQLRGHRWSGWRLDVWLSVALILVAGLAWLGWAPGGLAVVIAMAVVLLILWAAMLWAQRHQFVTFLPQQLPASPGPTAPLMPIDKVEGRATGQFEVEGKVQRFSEIRSYYRTFATGEHAVMAIVPPSRFLLLGTWPKCDVGMWYIFFRPEQVLELRAGLLHFDGAPRPALRVAYQASDRREAAYLSFDDHATRQRVWADIQKDVQKPAPTQAP
jgi:hypothetical protein